MKQMKECLDRAFSNKQPLAKKWRAIIVDGKLILKHYQHLVLVYDTLDDTVIHSWYEKPTDKRGLDSALKYLKERSKKDE